MGNTEAAMGMSRLPVCHAGTREVVNEFVLMKMLH